MKNADRHRLTHQTTEKEWRLLTLVAIGALVVGDVLVLVGRTLTLVTGVDAGRSSPGAQG